MRFITMGFMCMKITIIANGNLKRSIVDDSSIDWSDDNSFDFDRVMFFSIIATFVALIYHSRHLIKKA